MKALSWALRALAARDRDAIATFVEAHRARLAARVLREVHSQLETGLKRPRRRAAGVA